MFGYYRETQNKSQLKIILLAGNKNHNYLILYSNTHHIPLITNKTLFILKG